ncbi:MAG: cell division protein FtsA [Chloroflexi bacterium]|nr:cell division protein FtsA [Chloroflexota bacterium]
MRLDKDRLVVGIDAGTTKVCTLVGEPCENGNLRIIGVGACPSRGIRRGVVVNVEETEKAILASVEKAERIAGYKIQQACVGLAGPHVSSMNSRGVVAISRGDHEIIQEDVDRAVEAARAIAIPNNRQVLHVIPRGYIVDGQDGVKDPVGMLGFRLEVETHIVTGAAASVQNLVRCVQKGDVEVNDLVLDALASSEAVLTEEEKEMGVILADVGGGTTDIAIFMDGAAWHTTVLPVGGSHITNDIAVGLRTATATAEDIKIRCGYAVAAAVDEAEPVELVGFGRENQRVVSRRALSEIIELRSREIFGLILGEIKRSGYDGLLPAGLVLTGGTAELSGITELGSEILQLPVRVGYPRSLEGLSDVVSGPAYAAGVGLLVWSIANRDSPAKPVKKARPQRKKKPGGLLKLLRSFVP